ncbi:hypothetical protein BDZ94DRAFT_1273666 [Collybia nuda]|uniref:Uncharacterized protein n=1 Tax=Collybia nuda TaxID=64659 RepID=A0A9P6C9K6_9AGAR|nr:hypothetical protein BDZ94DRAFT_1273666 [Collybia nuda]
MRELGLVPHLGLHAASTSCPLQCNICTTTTYFRITSTNQQAMGRTFPLRKVCGRDK